MEKVVSVGTSGPITPPFERAVKTAQRNEAEGFDSLFWPDHLMSWHTRSVWRSEPQGISSLQANPDIYLDPVPAMAAIARHTQHLLLATGVTDPLRRHPAILAQSFLTLDHVSGGRVILGIGCGEAENTLPYGMDFRQPVGHLEEALQIIRLLWENEEPVDFQGRFWQLRRAVLGLGPHRPGRYPPIWIAAMGPRGLRLVASYGDGWLPTVMPAEEYAAKLETIRSLALEQGRDPVAIVPGLIANVVIDEDHERCHRLMESPIVKAFCLTLPAAAFQRHGTPHPLGEKAHGLIHFIPTQLSDEEGLAYAQGVPSAVAHETIFHGTPQDVADQILALVKVGLRHVVLWNIGFLADASTVGSSFRLLAEVLKYLGKGNVTQGTVRGSREAAEDG